MEGTGSVLQSCADVELETVFKSLEVLSKDEKLQQLSHLQLRYFTPREIANLMGFPAHFSKQVILHFKKNDKKKKDKLTSNRLS